MRQTFRLNIALAFVLLSLTVFARLTMPFGESAAVSGMDMAGVSKVKAER